MNPNDKRSRMDKPLIENPQPQMFDMASFEDLEVEDQNVAD